MRSRNNEKLEPVSTSLRSEPLGLIDHVARRTHASIVGEALRRDTPFMRRAVGLIMERFNGGVDLEELSRQCGMSKFHFLRRFRRESGITPGAFLQRYRLYQAMRLLARTRMSVRAVARSVGYQSPAAFSRAFQKAMRLTPRQYRMTRR